MDSGDVIIAGGGYIRLLPLTLTAGTSIISALGTAIDLLVISAEGEEVANVNQDVTYITLVSSAGYTYRYPQIQTTIDLAGGTVAPSGDNLDSITFSAGIAYADWITVVGILRDVDQAVAVICDAGKEAADGATEGTLHLMGKLQGNITRDKAHEVNVVQMTVAGGITYTSTPVFGDYNTKAAAAITAVGGAAVTPEAVTTGEYDTLLTGVIVHLVA